MRRYLLRKLGIYVITFVVAVTIDWSIPHLMPGNPVLTLMSRIQIKDPHVAQHVYDNYMRSFNLDLPLWKHFRRAASAPTLLPAYQLSRIAGSSSPSVYGMACRRIEVTGVGNCRMLVPRSPWKSETQK